MPFERNPPCTTTLSIRPRVGSPARCFLALPCKLCVSQLCRHRSLDLLLHLHAPPQPLWPCSGWRSFSAKFACVKEASNLNSACCCNSASFRSSARHSAVTPHDAPRLRLQLSQLTLKISCQETVFDGSLVCSGTSTSIVGNHVLPNVTMGCSASTRLTL